MFAIFIELLFEIKDYWFVVGNDETYIFMHTYFNKDNQTCF